MTTTTYHQTINHLCRQLESGNVPSLAEAERDERIVRLRNRMADLDRKLDELADQREDVWKELNSLQTGQMLDRIKDRPAETQQIVGALQGRGMADVARADEAEAFEQE